MSHLCRLLPVGLLLLGSLTAWAHKPSDSYLNLRLDGETVAVQWDIALRDLEYALGLDADDDGAITWGELRTRHQAIADYALARLNIRSGERVCSPQALRQAVDRHSDGAYTVLSFTLDCPAPNQSLHLAYRLFFDLDPTHRGLVQIRYPDHVQTIILSPEQPAITMDSAEYSRWWQFTDYWREGVWHIWIGFDHILFLLALLLPAVLWQKVGYRHETSSFRSALLSVAGVVTAFTVAHSITLSAAALGWVSLPSRWIESAIAATVLLAALNNLYPIIRGRLWPIAFCLGLIHGFGFASVLSDLGLPANALILALAGFNLGVETGQLAIVMAFLPLAFLWRDSWFYRRAVLQLGSVVVAAIASVWLVERSLNVHLNLLS